MDGSEVAGPERPSGGVPARVAWPDAQVSTNPLVGYDEQLIGARRHERSLVVEVGGCDHARAEWLAFSVVLALASPLILAVAIYLAVRWAVAVPAIVVESLGLRAGLARSTALTRRRMVHVFLALLVIVVVITILGWLIAALPLALAVLILISGGGPLLAIPAVLYVAGRVLIAPLAAILVALLYRDFGSAEAG